MKTTWHMELRDNSGTLRWEMTTENAISVPIAYCSIHKSYKGTEKAFKACKTPFHEVLRGRLAGWTFDVTEIKGE